MEEKNKDIEQEEIMRQAFPNEKDFSYSNVKDMKRWYLFYYERIIKGQQVVGLLELGVATYQLQEVVERTIADIESRKNNEEA